MNLRLQNSNYYLRQDYPKYTQLLSHCAKQSYLNKSHAPQSQLRDKTTHYLDYQRQPQPIRDNSHQVIPNQHVLNLIRFKQNQIDSRVQNKQITKSFDYTASKNKGWDLSSSVHTTAGPSNITRNKDDLNRTLNKINGIIKQQTPLNTKKIPRYVSQMSNQNSTPILIRQVSQFSCYTTPDIQDKGTELSKKIKQRKLEELANLLTNNQVMSVRSAFDDLLKNSPAIIAIRKLEFKKRLFRPKNLTLKLFRAL